MIFVVETAQNFARFAILAFCYFGRFAILAYTCQRKVTALDSFVHGFVDGYTQTVHYQAKVNHFYSFDHGIVDVSMRTFTCQRKVIAIDSFVHGFVDGYNQTCHHRSNVIEPLFLSQ